MYVPLKYLYGKLQDERSYVYFPDINEIYIIGLFTFENKFQ